MLQTWEGPVRKRTGCFPACSMGILTEHADQDNISREVTVELNYEDISIGPNIKCLQGRTACSLNSKLPPH